MPEKSVTTIPKGVKKVCSYDTARTQVAIGIRRLREVRGYTQEQLANKMKTKQSCISRLEDPSRESFSFSNLIKTLDVLDGELTITIGEIRA